MNSRIALTLAAAICLTGWTSQALAQPAAGPSLSTADLDTAPVDARLDLYWGKKQRLKALERANNPRGARHEFTLFGGVVPNEAFFSYYPVGARYSYFLSDDFGLEAWGAYTVTSDSELNTFITKELGNGIIEPDAIPPTMLFMAGASFIWSPIHGKFAFLTTKLTHFDLYTLAGASLFGVEQQSSSEGLQIKPGGHVGLGIRIQFLKWFAARFEYRQHFYDAQNGATVAPAELNFGVSFWTPPGQ